ncbi:MAG: hypothetical protein AB1529_01410 [Candidatus Micrarchaeota archaeon]
MRILLFGIFAALLLSGCIIPEQPAGERGEIEKELVASPPVQQEGLIIAGGDGKLSVVTIKAANASGRWQFPLENRTDEFAWAGLESDAYIELNRTHIAWLGDGESIWLTPMIRKGDKAVLFNAVYVNEPGDCGAAPLTMLGREYAAAGLQDGSSFENDDKWKVAVDSSAGCVKKVAIYMDGYFSDLGDGDQIPLFRNDNTVLFAFEGLGDEPQARLIATRPA